MIYLWKYIRSLNHSTLVQIGLTLFFVAVYFDLAALSPYTNKDNFDKITCLLILLLNLTALLPPVIIIINRIRLKTLNNEQNSKPNPFINKNSKSFRLCTAECPLIIILFIYIVVKIFYIDSMLRWDGAWYFCRLLESVESFDFTFGNFIKYFNWYGHPSMGYAFIMSINQFLDFGNHYLLNIQNLVLAVLAIFSFHKIVLYIYKEINQVEALLLTSLFAFNPLFFGVSLSFNLDFPLIVFLPALIWALLYNHLILSVLFGVILVFSKETGVLLYFTILFYYVLYYSIKNLAGKGLKPSQRLESSHKLIDRRILLSLIIPAVIFLLYLGYTKGQLWEAGSFGWNNEGVHGFGFNWSALTTRLAQIFVLNFSWIQTIICLLFIIKIFFSFMLKLSTAVVSSKYIKDILTMLLFVFIVFTLFNLFFITFNHPRYVLAAVFFLLLFTCGALLNICKKEQVRILILSAMLFLSCLQVFKTVDPLSEAMFKTINFGEHQLLNINPADGMVYNAEYTVIDEILNKLNQTININKNTAIIVSNIWDAHFNGDGLYSIINIDKSSLKRTFKRENSFQPEVYSIRNLNNGNKPAEAYYLQLWFGDKKAELEYLQKHYQIIRTDKIDHKGYSLNLYYLKQL